MGEADQQQHDEEDLILRMMYEDQDALREFITRFGPKTRHYLWSKFGKLLNDHDFDEVMNTAAFKAWRRADRYDSKLGGVGTWFTRIAYRVAQDILKKERSHRHAELQEDFANNLVADTRDIDDGPTKPYIAAVQEAIEKALTPDERKIVRYDLASPSGRSDDTYLAEITGKSKTTIQTLRSKARRKLREALTAKGFNQSTEKGRT